MTPCRDGLLRRQQIRPYREREVSTRQFDHIRQLTHRLREEVASQRNNYNVMGMVRTYRDTQIGSVEYDVVLVVFKNKR